MIENYEFDDFKLISGIDNLSDIYNMELDTFNNVSEPKVTGSISLYDLFNKIRYAFFLEDISISDYLTPKYIDNVKNPAYDEIKNNKQTVCYNATFNGYKDLNNFKSTTNLMFLDIDCFKTREEALAYKYLITKKYDWIIACNLSLSRIGLHIIILVDKIIDNEDFNCKYDFLSTVYFDGKLDKSAKSLTRHSIIPFDCSIYLNYNPDTLYIDDIINKISLKENDYQSNLISKNKLAKNDNDNTLAITKNNNKKSISSTYLKEEVIYTAYTFSDNRLKQILDNSARVDGLIFEEKLDESNFNDPNLPLYNHDGYDIIRINLFPYLHKKVGDGKRTSTIGAISVQLIYLNTNKFQAEPDNDTKEKIFNCIWKINKEICEPPMIIKEVRNSFNANWNRYVDGELDVDNYLIKQRSFWSCNSTLKSNDKRKITCKLKNEPIVELSKKLIADAIQSIHEGGEKITQVKVAEVSGLNVQTVKKYWSDEFKILVKELNLKTNSLI